MKDDDNKSCGIEKEEALHLKNHRMKYVVQAIIRRLLWNNNIEEFVRLVGPSTIRLYTEITRMEGLMVFEPSLLLIRLMREQTDGRTSVRVLFLRSTQTAILPHI